MSAKPSAQIESNVQGPNGQLDRHRLACGCAVKIDLQRVVYPALRKIRPELLELGVRLAEREDADIFPRTREFSFERRVLPFDPGKIEPLAPGGDLRAVTVSSVYRVLDPDALAERWLTAYRALLRGGATLHIGKGHTIEAYSPADEFIHFDLYASQGARVPGWRVANNDTIQLIDPTRDLGAPEQTDVALCNALNDLFSLGAVEEIAVYPFTAAPTASLAERISHNIQTFCEQHGFAYVPQEPISESTLLLGATVFGASSRELPTFYRELREGDLVLVHRPFGDLAPINVLIEALELGADALAGAPFALDDVREAVEERVAVMRKPNLDVGRVIQRFCPEWDEPFDGRKHIKATADLSGPGIDVFRELAELSGRDVVLERVPLAHPELVRRASENFLLPNGTAGTNGAIAVVAAPGVIERVAAELENLGHESQIIGRIGGPGGTLTVPRGTKRYIADRPAAYRVQE